MKYHCMIELNQNDVCHALILYLDRVHVLLQCNRASSAGRWSSIKNWNKMHIQIYSKKIIAEDNCFKTE